ncbi:MAG: hypothetical protein J5379_03000 [Clostridiales bacterium]|nr:hypothetical protein [Clostridiales bacterium]
MKKTDGKKFSALVLSLMMAGSTVLCSCTKSDSEDKDSAKTETTAATTVTETTTEATTEATTTTEATETTTLSAREASPYEEITLDGVKEHHFIATDYCYIETEKCFIFMEKDIEIPGDFAIVLDAIIVEIENELGISATPDDRNYFDVADMSVHYGFNPWEGWDIGNKIPVFLYVDHEEEGLISNACEDFCILAMWELFSDEFWNSVPSYVERSDARRDYVDYAEVAHEITHTITLRNCYLTDILAEGVADYMGRLVIDALADQYPSIAEVQEDRFLFDYMIPEVVNADNAERIFVEDYHDLSAADRGAEYVYGRYLCQFLEEEYGDDFYRQMNDKIKSKQLEYSSYNYDEAVAAQYAEALKEVFGDDVFTKFGKWCVSNHALQELGGWFPMD